MFNTMISDDIMYFICSIVFIDFYLEILTLIDLFFFMLNIINNNVHLLYWILIILCRYILCTLHFYFILLKYRLGLTILKVINTF